MARKKTIRFRRLSTLATGRQQKSNRAGSIGASHREIVGYWAEHMDECGLSVDWAEAEKLCWRCAQPRLLQRCHIVPRALGGSDDVSNLILLCGQCHAEAPNVSDPEFMWTWLRAHAAVLYGTYWYIRGVREYELIYGKALLDECIQDSSILLPKIHASLAKYMEQTSTHWGQGKINPATIAWLLRQIVQECGPCKSRKGRRSIKQMGRIPKSLR